MDNIVGKFTVSLNDNYDISLDINNEGLSIDLLGKFLYLINSGGLINQILKYLHEHFTQEEVMKILQNWHEMQVNDAMKNPNAPCISPMQIFKSSNNVEEDEDEID